MSNSIDDELNTLIGLISSSNGDLGARTTDKAILDLEKQIYSLYDEAARDIQLKMDDFTRRYEIKERIYRERLNKGEITKEDYDRWVKGQIFQSKQWKNKKKDIEQILTNANKTAVQMINNQSIHVFSDNANYQSYLLEKKANVNFGFTLYDSSTVTNLIKNNPKVLPEWKINEPKDYVWNGKKVNRQITLGIIEGESLEKISKRLAENLSTQNMNHMRTFARTAMTGAQNSGRNESLKRAKEMGINVVKEWMATLDGRTRDSHRDMDGEQIPVGDKWNTTRFSNKLRFPGDPEGPAREVYNCRCTLVGDLVDFPAEYERYDNIDGRPIENMTYREWERAKKGITDIDVFQYKLGKARTVQEVTDLMNNQGWFRYIKGAGMYSQAELTGCDIDSAKSIAASYQQVFNKYPKLIGKFDAPNASPRNMKDNTYAWCYIRRNGQVQVNPNHYNNWKKLSKSYEEDVIRGFHPRGTTAESIVIHEIGHAIDGLLAREKILGGYTSSGEFRYASSSLKSKVMSRAAQLDPEGVGKFYRPGKDYEGSRQYTVMMHVSEYATKDNQEWFAECFAEYITSANPRVVATEFGKELEELIERL